YYLVCFFFSSRRRHTRFSRDWSSDVCSSDLQIRTGMGFDVHQFAVGEDLWLGGIKIDHDKGLAGHSDADVLLHALTDALLGAARSEERRVGKECRRRWVG